MSDRIQRLEAALGHSFADRELLERALTHSSFGDGKRRTRDNERLEFLGDRVLGLLAAEHVFSTFDDAREGGLAPRLNALVRKEACARAAQRMELGRAILMSRAEEAAGGREKERVLGDACEAVMAALYLDGGLAPARAVFERFWADEFARVEVRPKDPKSALQEWALAKGLPMPRYDVTGRKGPDHRPTFTVCVAVEGLGEAVGEGGSKQDAEREAAAAFLAAQGGRRAG